MFLSALPLIINGQRPLQGKIEIIRRCIRRNNHFSHNSILDGNSLSRGCGGVEIPGSGSGGGGCDKHPLEWKFLEGDGSKAKLSSVEGEGIDIFWN